MPPPMFLRGPNTEGLVRLQPKFAIPPALGELMTKVMTGARTADIPTILSLYLDASDVEPSLAAWCKDCVSWIAQDPEIVERMRRPEDNLRKGLSFETVTDLQLKAGGW